MKETAALEELIFSEAIELPQADRSRFIESRCGRDSATVERILALVEGYEKNSGYLETPPAIEAVVDAHDNKTDLLPEPAPGDRIARYRLLERIGEGGFGVVYRAEQEEPVRRPVAIKIIRLGMDTREFIARFNAERQALALMDHPNIARVFDAGATETGRPFLVMELVRGISITRYCDENNLSLAVRLELFARVCGAIQHAHQKGVIHRDLKPSNILVALDEGEPVPKVIDFGIAKATHEQPAEKTLFTRGHVLMGTPAYTSPEQMEMSGLDVDTRSDIYSLGVLLYELLTGCQPFERATLQRASLEELRRIIREVEPPRPSARVSGLSVADRASIAAKRGLEPAKLSPRLQSDLDWIVMRCLEKDRTRRYETANALAMDIRRHLENEPVVARPPSRTYQWRKFIRRNRTVAAAAAAIMVSLGGGLVASSVLLGRARVAERAQAGLREKAEASAAAARVEAAKSAQVAQFMADMLNGVAPSVALGRDTAMLGEVLDKTAQRLDGELHDQPAVAAKLRDMLGVVYTDLSQYAKAELLLREAVATRRRLPGAEVDLATSLHHLGIVESRLARYAESEQLLREALEIRRRVLGNEHVDVASVLADLANPVRDLGKRQEYEALCREALAMRRRLLGNEHLDVASSLHDLGEVARSKGDLTEAETLFREALAIRRKKVGDDPDTAAALDSLGLVLRTQQKWAEAIPLCREALAIQRKIFGEIHPNVLVPLLRLAGMLPAVGQRDEAIALLRDALARERKVAGDEAIETVPTLFALAALLGHEGGHPDEVREITQSARRILEHAGSEGTQLSYGAATSMFGFAIILILSDASADALVIAKEAHRSLALSLGPDHREVWAADLLIASLELNCGNLEEARRRFEDTRKNTVFVRQSKQPTLLRSMVGLGIVYRAMGRLADSQRVLEEVLVGYAQGNWNAFAPEGEITSGISKPAVQCQLAWTLNREGNFTEAEKLSRNVLSAAGISATNPLAEARAESLLGEALTGQQRFPEAEPLVLRGFLDLKRCENFIAGNRKKEFREAIDRAVRLYTAWGKPETAAEWQAELAEFAPGAKR